MFNFKKNKKGFTLVELLVVISIIGILSSLATVSVNIARVRARDAKRKADISQVRLALYLYYDDNLEYPNTGSLLPEHIGEFGVINWQTILLPALSGQAGGKVYMLRPPADPLNYEPYFYRYASDGREFVIHYYLEQGGPVEIHDY